jgi:hypothetical protein
MLSDDNDLLIEITEIFNREQYSKPVVHFRSARWDTFTPPFIDLLALPEWLEKPLKILLRFIKGFVYDQGLLVFGKRARSGNK